MNTLHIQVDVERTPRIQAYLDILSSEVRERAGVALQETQSVGANLILHIRDSIGIEGFSITDESDGAICITGNDELGLLYGIGKFLHDGRYVTGEFTAGPWRGTSIPQGLVRGMYLAFHDNWYNKAPEKEVHRYIDAMALWGMNSLLFHLPSYDHTATEEVPYQTERGRRIVRYARELGIKVGLIAEANISYSEVPPELLAPEFPDTDPVKRGFVGTRVCTSIPEGFELMARQIDQYLDLCSDIGLDYAVAFPYDSGGCGCENCWPWGARGYVRMSKEMSRLAKYKYPDLKFILGTWCYDVREESDGEYDGLEQILAEDKSWVDFIMADSHGDFPEYPLRPGALAGVPIINFAEISMWGRFPWGGSGANPFPMRLQKFWDQSSHVLTGGFPYSEGNFEDINKIVTLRFFWDRATRAETAVREYIAYEFGADVVEPVLEAIMLMEHTLQEWDRKPEDVERVYQLITEADAKLSEQVRNSWRWQILYWRAIIDFEKSTHNNQVTDRCDDAYEKLIEVLYLEDGWRAVTPPSRAYLARFHAKETPAEESLEAVLPGAAPGTSA